MFGIRIRHSSWCSLCLLPLVSSFACYAGRTVETHEPDRPGEPRTTRSTEIHTDRNEARIEEGRLALIDGAYDDAHEAFLRVYTDRSAKPEWRSTALYELGRVHSHLLNPQKDYEKARSYLETLVSEFPDSDRREDAESLMQEIEMLESKLESE